MTKWEKQQMLAYELAPYEAGADPDDIGYPEDEWCFDEDDQREWDRDE